jgi:hypothetical protein
MQLPRSLLDGSDNLTCSLRTELDYHAQSSFSRKLPQNVRCHMSYFWASLNGISAISDLHRVYTISHRYISAVRYFRLTVIVIFGSRRGTNAGSEPLLVVRETYRHEHMLPADW